MVAPITARENYLRAVTFRNPDHIPYEDVVRNLFFIGDMMWMEQRGYDIWGVGWDYELKEYLPMVVDHPIKRPEDIDHFRPPEPVFQLTQAAVEFMKTEDLSSFVLSGFHPNILFERAWFLMGMEQFFELIMTDTARAKKLLHLIADFNVEIARQYIQQPIECIFVGDDYGNQSALMMSPVLWRELIKPELSRVLQVYRQAGKIIKFHSCGHITEIVEDLIEIGVNIIHPCQARANNLAEWGERFTGRVVFDGGVDTQYTMMMGTPDEIRAEARLRLQQLGRDPGGGLLLWADQNMPFPDQNRQALLDFVIQNGKYPLRLDP